MGKKVRILFDGTFDQRNTKIVWNGLDNQGSPSKWRDLYLPDVINGAHVKSQR